MRKLRWYWVKHHLAVERIEAYSAKEAVEILRIQYGSYGEPYYAALEKGGANHELRTYETAEWLFLALLSIQRQRFSLRRAERLSSLFRTMEQRAYA